MKQKSLIHFCILMIFYSQLFAQQIKTIPDPEFINQIYFYDSSTNSLKSLEKTTAEYKGKAKGLGLGGGKVICEVKGNTSTISLDPSKQLSFVVQLGENAADLSLWFQLYKAEAKKGKRETIYVDENTVGGSKNNDNIIRYDVKKLKDKVYHFFPSKKLEKGEYFFLNKMSIYSGRPITDVFCFSVN